MLNISTLLNHYKRIDIQKAMLESAKDREVATQFQSLGDVGKKGGFGKRPDVLSYESDVLELVKQGATSFHVSEEIWSNPLTLEPTLNRKSLDEIRTGWDLVLDIDCIDWEFSKLTAKLFISALQKSGIKSISCKFSGNKGFHIGVPFEAFPKKVSGKKTNELFPEGPRKIAKYLLNIISLYYVKVNNNIVTFDKNHSFSVEALRNKFGEKEFIIKKCKKCNNKIKPREEIKYEFVCPRCGKNEKSSNAYLSCAKCKVIMQRITVKRSLCTCGGDEYNSVFDPLSIVEVDTVLIASRHLYRMPYSLHEKSGLVSIPINPNKVLDFNKIIAKPENVRISKYKFLDKSNIVLNEGKKLIVEAFDYEEKKENIKIKTEFKYEDIKEALPEQFFPPCINKILNGMDDGKKRALFVLVNFLTSVGWNYDKIEERLKEWNKKNKEPLREVYMFGQIRYHKTHKKRVLPPNCDNKAYYHDLLICNPDELCKKIKNPVSYSRRKTMFLGKEKKKDGVKANKEIVKKIK